MRRSGKTAGILLALLAFMCSGPARAQEAAKETEADLQFEFAEKLFEIKVYKTAGAEYRRFLKDYPKDPRREEARYKLALCYVKLGGEKDAGNALAELATLRKEFPNGKRIQDALFRTGHVRYVLGDARGAINDLTELSNLKVRPDLVFPMHHFLGRAQYDLGQFPAALKHLLIVAEAPKDDKLRPYALMILADVQLKMKRLGDGAATLERLLADHPDLPTRDEMWIKLGDARVSLKQFGKALDAYRKVGAKGAFADAAAVGQARALLGLKKYADAVNVCEEVLARLKKTPAADELRLPEQCLYIAGLAHFAREKYAEAAEAFTRLLMTVPQGRMPEDAAHKLCWCYYRQGPKLGKKLVSSCITFRRLFPASKWAGETVFLTAEGYLSLGDYASAIRHYKEIGEKDPNYADALYRIAYCHHKRKQPADAARAYDLFVRKFDRHQKAAAALAAAAGLFQAAEKYKEAVGRYDRYLATSPDGPEAEEALYQRGVCLAKMERFADMAAAFAAYTKRFPQGKYAAAAFRWLGRHHRIRGDELTKKGDTAGAIKQHSAAQLAFSSSVALGAPLKHEALLGLGESCYGLGKSLRREAEAVMARAKAAEGPQEQQLEQQAAGLEKDAAASFEKAAKTFRAVMSEKPGLVGEESVYFWTGAYFREHKDPKSAVLVFKALLDHFKLPEKPDAALHQLALLYGELEPPDYNAIIKYCDELLAEHPGSKLALQTQFAKAEALYRLRKYGAAEKLYREVSQRGADALKVGSAMKLGHICFAREEYADAARYFAEIGLLYDDKEFTPEALYFAGSANFLLKDFDDAVKFWQRLLAKYPASQWAAEAKKELGPHGYGVGPDGSITKQ